MEFWALAGLAVGTQVVGGYMSSRASRKGQELQGEQAIAQQQEGGRQDRETLRYQGELTNYWRNRVTQDRRDARGAMFDKYSRIAKPEGHTRRDLYEGEAPIANPVPVTATPPNQTGGRGSIAAPTTRR